MDARDLKVSKINVKENLDALFALDVKVAKARPALLPLETKKALLAFLTKDHDSETWLWRASDASPVAYVSLIDKPKEGVMEVLRICVDPAFQSKGIGRLMMGFAEKLAAKLGRKRMELVTNKKNLEAIGFYKRMGYGIVKEMKNYYGDGETRYLCEKTVRT